MRISVRHSFIWLSLSITAFAQTESLEDLLKAHLSENPELPSLAAIVIVNGEVKALGASGVRKLGDSTPVTIDDKYHIGSCTKAFTATLAASLEEEGILSWDSTIGERLQIFRPANGYQTSTLKQLVSNTGGFPHTVPPKIWRDAWAAKGTPPQERSAFATAMLAEEPEYTPGSRNVYSNTGFTMAGIMMEQTTGKSWEDLIRERIFQPLKMQTAGFYGPATDSKRPDQPWGHNKDGKPMPPGRGADNPPAIAPAGAIHCSISDLARWVQMHLHQETGPVLQKKSSYQTLHTAVRNDYALGWVTAERDWANGTALRHTGSNTMYTTVIWIAPERDFAVIVSSNIGSSMALKPSDALVWKLIQRYL